MDGVAVLVAAAAGALGGGLAGPVADWVGAALYGPGTDGHDPDDQALAPLSTPTTTTQRAALAGLGAAVVGAFADRLGAGLVVLLFGALFVAYLAAMVVDLQYLRLPNRFTYPCAALVVVAGVALSAHFDVPATGIWVGGLGYAGFLLLVRIAYQLVRGREGMGLGDIKLALSLGGSIGWLGGALVHEPDPTALVVTSPALGAFRLVIYAALLGNLLGAVVGILATRRIDREFPFGPALVGGWVVVVLLAQTIST
jgi:prepilin signal peptidase PulO-like enzyme (type II secretory pathway)